MLKYVRNRMGLKHTICWYAPGAPRFSPFRFDEYRQCFEKADRKGYRRTTFQTVLFDLSQDMSQLFSQFNATTRKEIRRAERSGIEVSDVKDRAIFVKFYNEYAVSKNRDLISEAELSIYQDDIVIRAASVDGKTFIMQSYLCDEGNGYVRGIHSASHFRLCDQTSEKHAASAANSYLTFSNMAYFKDRNLKTFDFGGLPPPGSSDAALNQIAQFKRRFGGVEVEHFDYMSVNLVVALAVKVAVARGMSRLKHELAAFANLLRTNGMRAGNRAEAAAEFARND